MRPWRRASSRLARGLLAGVAALTWGCGGTPSAGSSDVTPSSPTAEAPPAVPLPQLGGFDDSVQQQLREAHAELQSAIAAGTASGEQYGRLGMQFAGYGLVDAAEAAYLNARSFAPEEFRWGYYLGVLYDTTSRPEQAIPALEQALRLRPEYVAGLARLGDLLAGQDRAEEATLRYRDALALDPACNPCLVGLGQLALQDGEFDTAAAHLERALELAPAASTIRYSLALAYRGLGDDAKAQEQLDARAEATLNTGIGRQIDRPGVFDSLLLELEGAAVAGNVAIEARGVMAARAGRWTQAVAEFETLVATDPENAVSRNLLALALLTSGDRAGAREQYTETLRIDPSHARANMQLGLLLVEDGQEQQAIARFRAAVEADPGSNLAQLNLAAALLRNGDAVAAADVYNGLIELDPSNAPARLGRAFAFIRAGRHADAKTGLEEDMLARPNELAFSHVLARLLAASHDDRVRDGQRAAELIEQVSRTVKTAQVAETTAMVVAEIGAFDAAVQSQEIAIRIATESGNAALAADLGAGLAQYRLGQPSRIPFLPNDAVFFPAPFRPPGAFDEESR